MIQTNIYEVTKIAFDCIDIDNSEDIDEIELEKKIISNFK